MNYFATTIMCLSFVTELYEILVEERTSMPIRYTGGGTGWAQTKESRSVYKGEDYVRSILTEEQWQNLVSNSIIECKIRLG